MNLTRLTEPLVDVAVHHQDPAPSPQALAGDAAEAVALVTIVEALETKTQAREAVAVVTSAATANAATINVAVVTIEVTEVKMDPLLLD